MTSVTAWASPQVVITTANVPTLPTLRVEVDSKAGEWHRRYHDLEASLYQVQAELSSVKERERSLIARNLELERQQSGWSAMEGALQDARKELSSQKSSALELQRRLDAALKNGSSKEGLCEQLRAQLRSREVELEKSKEEVQKLRVEFNKDQELHHRSMSELRDVFERQLEKMREEVRVKEQDLHKVRTGLQKEEKLHYNAVSEICDLRHRLKVALEQESKHLRMVETLQSERELWLRSDTYCWCKPAEVVDITITPTAPLYPAPRRLFCRRLA